MVTPEELLRDPSTPFWAADVIRVALEKDCVDAANVLSVLADAFRTRLKRLADVKCKHTYNAAVCSVCRFGPEKGGN